MRSYARVAWLIVFGMMLLFFDFITKAYVYHIFPFNHSAGGVDSFSVPVFSHFFGIDFFISLATNTGAAWGIFENFQIFLVTMRIVVIVGLFIYLFFINRYGGYDFPLVLIIAGALGNIIDFFLYGFVVDFLHFVFWGAQFPIFNFADTWITIGVCLLMLLSYLKSRGKQKDLLNLSQK